MYTFIALIALFYVGIFCLARGMKKKQPKLTIVGFILYVVAGIWLIFIVLGWIFTLVSKFI